MLSEAYSEFECKLGQLFTKEFDHSTNCSEINKIEQNCQIELHGIRIIVC